VTNQATGGPQAALNASISAGAPLTASGSFNLLDPGQTNAGALQVGMNTATAGSRNGVVTVSFQSDASNIGGCAPNCVLNLASQNVNVTGAVYEVAQPSFAATVVNLGNVRVGGAAQQALSLSNTNVAPGFQEGLSASVGGATAGFSAGGSFANLAAGGTNAASLLVGLDTSVAGAKAGTATVSLTSTGAGTSGLSDLSLGTQLINLSGKVYAPAVDQLNTTSIDFGIVRVGDSIAGRNVSVTNAAAAQALNDTLLARFGAVDSPFNGSGQAAGLGAGASNPSGSMLVGINTSSAGVFSGVAKVDFASQNPDMADLALGTRSILLSGQVNNLANADFDLLSASGVLRRSGDAYVLDFGNVLLGSMIAALLQIDNDVSGPADLLSGSFDLSAVNDFGSAGWNPFSGLGAGEAFGGLKLSFDAASLGLFEDMILFSGVSTNASDPSGVLQMRTLLVRANVVAGSVPEPGTLALLFLAVMFLAMLSRHGREYGGRRG
jgi:hypothetical protein